MSCLLSILYAIFEAKHHSGALKLTWCSADAVNLPYGKNSKLQLRALKVPTVPEDFVKV